MTRRKADRHLYSVAEKKEALRPERRLLAYIAAYWHLFALGLLCTLFVSSIEVWFIDLIRRVVQATIQTQIATGSASELNRVALMIVGAHLVKWFFAVGQVYLISSATQKIAVRLRNDLYSHLQSLSLSFFERTKVGHLMSRMTNDISLVQGSAGQIIQVVYAPLVGLGCIVMIFYYQWKLALVSIVLLPAISIAISRIGQGMRGLTEILQMRLADVAAIVQETLSGVRIVKSFGTEDYEISRFAEENVRTYRSAMRAVRRSAVMSPTVELIGILGIAFVLWYGGHQIAYNARHGIEGFGTANLIAFLFALERIANSARQIAQLNVTYHQTMAGAQRIFDVLDEQPDVQDLPDAVPIPPIEGHIEFRNVYFSYDAAKPVLNGVSFEVEPGQQVALVGPSGAGKSTIANLIPRFYDVSEGMVLIDGFDVRSVTCASLRRQIAIVPQETILFSTTVRENIAYGRMDATDEEIIAAAKAANAHDFIQRLPEGYDTLVGERGTRLSGGERQRISIARALLKNPRLLILDEATSSLDVASEAVVQEALDRLMQNRTTLIIAHRLSTVVNADQILVMKEGRIVESGTHHQLLRENGLYAELYAVQSKGTASV